MNSNTKDKNTNEKKKYNLNYVIYNVTISGNKFYNCSHGIVGFVLHDCKFIGNLFSNTDYGF